MKIYIGNDHTGTLMKEILQKHLLSKGYKVINLGTDSNEAVDYPDYGFKIGEKVAKDPGSIGIAICGTGIGISIAANKVKGVRAALCRDEKDAQLAIEHNNANILVLGARIIAEKKAIWIMDTFLGSKFLGEQHTPRVNKIDKY